MWILSVHLKFVIHNKIKVSVRAIAITMSYTKQIKVLKQSSMFYGRSHSNAGDTWLTNRESKWRCLKRRMFVATTTSLDWRDVVTPLVMLTFFLRRKGIFRFSFSKDHTFPLKHFMISILFISIKQLSPIYDIDYIFSFIQKIVRMK